MMRIKKFLIAFAAMLTLGLGSAVAQTFNSDVFEKSKEQLIIHSSTFALADFCLEDGTKLSTKELNEVLMQIPENRELIGKAKGWKAAGYGFIALAAAAVGTNVAYTFNDSLPAADVVVPVTAYTALLSSLLGVISSEVSIWYEMRAVDNHNMQVKLMGVRVN